MPGTARPNLGIISGYSAGEDGWDTGMEANLRRADSLIMVSVKDKDLNAPPGSPADGDRYIVGPSPTGAWATKAGQIATWESGPAAWTFYVPKNGWRTLIEDEKTLYAHNGTAWALDERVVNVKRCGAKGDGTTNDTAAINTAIAAAEAAKAVLFFPPATTAYVSTTGAFVLKRGTVIMGYGATLKLAASSGTLLTFGNGTDNEHDAGGLFGLSLAGNGGGSDTSIGIQIGNGSASAHNITVRDAQIKDFGHGVVIAGAGQAHDVKLDNLNIVFNKFNGIRLDATFANEQYYLSDSFITGNGTGQATGAGIQAAASSKNHLTITNCIMNSNSNGTLAQIYAPSNALLNLQMQNVDMESNGDPEQIAILLLGVGNEHSKLNLCQCSLAQFGHSAPTKPLIRIASCDVVIVNSFFAKDYGSTVVPMIDIGNGVTLQWNSLIMRNTKFSGFITSANSQVLAWTGSSGGFASLNVMGTVLQGFDTATNIVNLPVDLNGMHDLVKPTQSPAVLGGAVFTQLIVQNSGNNRYKGIFQGDSLDLGTLDVLTPIRLTVTNGEGHFKTPVVLTANLPAANAVHNGKVLIEDAGAGNRNIIIYAGGERFRIDGGSTF